MNDYGWDKSLNVKTMGRSVFISLIRSRSRSCIRCWGWSTPRTVRNRDRCISFFIIQVKSIFRISYGMTGSYSWTRSRLRIFFRGRTRESGLWCSRWLCKFGVGRRISRLEGPLLWADSRSHEYDCYISANKKDISSSHLGYGKRWLVIVFYPICRI